MSKKEKVLTFLKYSLRNRDKLCQNSFESLKQTLTSDVVLAHPDYEKTFHVFTDASNIAVGAVLMQQDKK